MATTTRDAASGFAHVVEGVAGTLAHAAEDMVVVSTGDAATVTRNSHVVTQTMRQSMAVTAVDVSSVDVTRRLPHTSLCVTSHSPVALRHMSCRLTHDTPSAASGVAVVVAMGHVPDMTV
mmetsp:Transcript_116288/g.173736  ORF Transcript_116288/g.173736 Transcript_116288/m.173736 type:complete len:120 (+) Transcript_116288:554-913(+)